MSQSAHILIVDDEPDTVEILSTRLGRENYKVFKAYSGKEGLALLRKNKLDLVLMDLTMPGMDGFETILNIRSLVKEFIPIIIITASKDDTKSVIRGFAAGADDYIVIPCHKEELLARIRAMLRIKELHDQLNEKNRKLTEAYRQLRVSREQFRDLVETTSDFIWEMDQAGVYTYVSPAVQSLLGYDPKEARGKTPFDLMPPDEARRVRGLFAAIAAERKPFTNLENLNLHKDGHGVILESSGVPILDDHGNLTGYRGIDRDITERKRSEERLERVNRCLLSLGSDFDENVKRITALCGELLGGTCALYNRLEGGLLCALGQWRTPPDFQPKDKPQGHICYDVIGRVSGEDLLFVPDLLNTRYAQTDPNVRRFGLRSYLGHVVHCIDKPVGSLCVVFRHSYAPAENDKRLLGIMAAALSAEENRHAAEKRAAMFSEAIENAHHGCLITSQDYKVIFGNHYALAKLGLDAEELKRLDWFSLCADRERAGDAVQTIRITNRWAGEVAIVQKDGGEFPALVSITAIKADDKKIGPEGYIILFQDISTRKELQNKLLISEKLAVMGRLVADVAHEINNPLAIIIGGAQLMLSRVGEKQAALKTQLETILRNARRCKTIMANLLGYGRTLGRKEETIVLFDLLREAIDAVNYQYDMNGIDMELNHAQADDAEIIGNRSALLSVFINLIRNARQAMGVKGRLAIAISQLKGNIIRIAIQDNGIGLGKKQIAGLFTPFRSGWKDGEGSGLGLATSMGIVETHGGRMTVESEGEGKGATFTILLPGKIKGDKLGK